MSHWNSIKFVSDILLIPLLLESKERIIDLSSDNVYITLFVLSFILLAWIVAVDRKKIELYFKAFFYSKGGGQQEGSVFSKTSKVNIVLKFIYFVSLAIMGFKLLGGKLFDDNIREIFGVLAILALIIAWFFVRNLLSMLIGWVFNLVDLARESVFFNQLSSSVVGVLIFPLTVFLFYQNIINDVVSVYIVLAVVGFSIVLKYKNLIELSFSKFKLPLYYNILYICTLEILPLIVFMKMLIGKM